MTPPASSIVYPFSPNSQVLLGSVSLQTVSPPPFQAGEFPFLFEDMILVLTTFRRLSLVARLAMVSKSQNFLYHRVWSTSALASSYPEDSFCNTGLTVSPLLKKKKQQLRGIP